MKLIRILIIALAGMVGSIQGRVISCAQDCFDILPNDQCIDSLRERLAVAVLASTKKKAPVQARVSLWGAAIVRGRELLGSPSRFEGLEEVIAYCLAQQEREFHGRVGGADKWVAAGIAVAVLIIGFYLGRKTLSREPSVEEQALQRARSVLLSALRRQERQLVKLIGEQQKERLFAEVQKLPSSKHLIELSRRYGLGDDEALVKIMDGQELLVPAIASPAHVGDKTRLQAMGNNGQCQICFDPLKDYASLVLLAHGGNREHVFPLPACARFAHVHCYEQYKSKAAGKDLRCLGCNQHQITPVSFQDFSWRPHGAQECAAALKLS